MFESPMTNILQSRKKPTSLSLIVSGRDRPLYFRSPLVSQIAVNLPLDEEKQGQDVSRKKSVPVAIEKLEGKAEMGIQTNYRESESQTLPYTPKYMLNEDENPEILSLANLKYGQGLPASIDELEAIELAREKLWFEASLPPISDEASFGLRRKLMDEQEVRGWHKKEFEIKKVQNEKLYLLQNALIEREKEIEERNAQRIEDIRAKKREQKNRLVAKIQRKKIKILRKLIKRRKDQDKDKRKRDIIEEYANFGSQVYAGITRDGLSLDKLSYKFEVQPASLNTYDGITNLVATFPRNVFETTINVKRILGEIEKKYTRLEDHHRAELKKAQKALYEKKEEAKDEGTLYHKYSLSKMRERPPTPVYPYEERLALKEVLSITALETRSAKALEILELDSSVLLIQRILRGRAMQNVMFVGKEKRLALIEELLAVAKISDLPEDEAVAIIREDQSSKMQNAFLEALQGSVFTSALETMSLELIKRQQEAKINRVMHEANEMRRKREAIEAGRRQAEEELREREEEMYREMMNVHQTSVDQFLSNIIASTIDQASSRQAYIMTKVRKDKMIKPIDIIERQISSKETIIKNLVSSFLIPSIQRNQIQRRSFLLNFS